MQLEVQVDLEPFLNCRQWVFLIKMSACDAYVCVGVCVCHESSFGEEWTLP